MNGRLWRCVGPLGALLLSVQAPARAAEDVGKVLERQTQELTDAVSSGTAAAWEKYLDAQAVYTAEDGSVQKKAEMVKQIKPLPEGVSGVLKVIDFSVTVHGTVAVATYVIDENEDYHGHKLHCQYRSTDTWVPSPAGWRLLASQVLALKTDPPAVPLAAQKLDEYSGRYALTPSIAYEIRKKDGGLEGQRTGRPVEILKAEAPDVLFVPGQPRYRKIFLRAADGHVTGFVERREAWDIEWTRVR